jgi:hypothetical protein
MASTPANLSAAVTRILSLTGFPKELKTKDIQTAFSEWENQGGGFKIKWIDDTSLYIVFQDATVAKRAYLQTIASPPAAFNNPDGVTAIIRPYDGPDAQQVIQAINARQNNNSRRSASISVPGPRGGAIGSRPGHASHASMSVAGLPSALSLVGNGPPSPSLPDIPSHPTLNSLIDATLNANSSMNGSGPRIGDPGKRMLGHALGVRPPGLQGRSSNGAPTLAMGGLTITE